MPEQYLQKGPMRFDYGGKEYTAGYERTFGPKYCTQEHNLEIVDADATVCGKLICKRCDAYCVVTTNKEAELCAICGLPVHMHTPDRTKVTVEGFGSVNCQPRNKK